MWGWEALRPHNIIRAALLRTTIAIDSGNGVPAPDTRPAPFLPVGAPVLGVDNPLAAPVDFWIVVAVPLDVLALAGAALA